MANEKIIIEKLANIEKMLGEQNEEVLDFERAAKFLSFSKSYLYKLTSTNQVPHYKPAGKRIYFSKSELRNWLLRNPVKTDAEIDQEANDYVVNSKKRIQQ